MATFNIEIEHLPEGGIYLVILDTLWSDGSPMWGKGATGQLGAAAVFDDRVPLWAAVLSLVPDALMSPDDE